MLQAAKDPIFFKGGQPNFFVYAANDPINKIDRSGLLSSYWHYRITYCAAKALGRSDWDSWMLAMSAVTPDISLASIFSSDAADTNSHGMAGTLPGGEWQTRDAAISSSSDYIRSSIEAGDIGNAMHAAQDLATPGHNGNRYEGWKSFSAEHRAGDRNPSSTTIRNAYDATIRVLQGQW